MNKFKPQSVETIVKTMYAFSDGKLKNGQSGKRITNRKQAFAIGISTAGTRHQKTAGQKGQHQ